MFNDFLSYSSVMLFNHAILKPVDCFVMNSNNCMFTTPWTSDVHYDDFTAADRQESKPAPGPAPVRAGVNFVYFWCYRPEMQPTF